LSETSTEISWNQINPHKGNFASDALGFHRPCPVCGSLHAKAVLELSDFQFYSDSEEEPKRFDVRESMCLDCFTLYLNPCYSDYGFSVLFAEAGQSYGSLLGHTQAQIEWLSTHGLLEDTARVLDVGCYDGAFLARLPANVHKMGVDIDEPAIERGRQQYADQSITFFHGDFETFAFHGDAPDTITMFHVLEHLPRPVKVLEKLRSISKDSTLIVIEVPILENGKINDINGFFSIQHMTHFSRTTLNNCLNAAGWHIEEQYETPDYNGYRVLAAPQSDKNGESEMKIAEEDWIEVNASLATWHAAVADVEKITQNIPDLDRIVIWGGGAHTEFLYQVSSLFHARKDTEFVIVDSDPLKHGKSWRGISIYAPSVIADMDWSTTCLFISSYGGQEPIFKAAVEFNVPENRIVRLYDSIRRY